MKTWTETLTLAALAATLTLAGCQDDGPGSMIEADEAELIEVNGMMLTPEEYDYETRVFPARMAAEGAAMEEIRRTFSVEDYEAELWVERWPEIWGPDGWAQNSTHSDPVYRFHDRIDMEMHERYGEGWEIDEAVIAEARASMTTDLDRHLFDSGLEHSRWRRETRERAAEHWRERRAELRAEEVRR